MGYIQIDTIRYDTNPQKAAKFTSTTVGSLIERLSKYDKDMSVIVKGNAIGYTEYEIIGRIEQK